MIGTHERLMELIRRKVGFAIRRRYRGDRGAA
jgi:hypothetical protein